MPKPEFQIVIKNIPKGFKFLDLYELLRGMGEAEEFFVPQNGDRYASFGFLSFKDKNITNAMLRQGEITFDGRRINDENFDKEKKKGRKERQSRKRKNDCVIYHIIKRELNLLPL